MDSPIKGRNLPSSRYTGWRRRRRRCQTTLATTKTMLCGIAHACHFADIGCVKVVYFLI